MYNYYKNSKESLLKDFIWNPKSIKKPNAKHKKQWSSPHWQQKIPLIKEINIRRAIGPKAIIMRKYFCSSGVEYTLISLWGGD